MSDQKLSRHYGMPIEMNSRQGPGRGPAPTTIPERHWWQRWRMFDDLMWEALDTLRQEQFRATLANLPDGWPTPESGLLSIRQMEWVRVHMIEGRHLDAKARLFA